MNKYGMYLFFFTSTCAAAANTIEIVTTTRIGARGIQVFFCKISDGSCAVISVDRLSCVEVVHNDVTIPIEGDSLTGNLIIAAALLKTPDLVEKISNLVSEKERKRFKIPLPKGIPKLEDFDLSPSSDDDSVSQESSPPRKLACKSPRIMFG